MLERASLLAALLLAVDGLHMEFQQKPGGARLGQAGQELSGAARAAGEAEWPWHFGGHHAEESKAQQQLTDAAPTAPVAAPKAAPLQRERLAVLVTGSVERLLLAPLLSNVVRANAKNGLQVDLFLSLQAPSNIAQAAAEYETAVDNAASDPKIAQLLQGASADNFNSTVMDQICSLARAQHASSCQWDIEGGDLGPIDGATDDTSPTDRVAANAASGTSQAAVARWRSQSRLWSRALAQEAPQRKYAAVLVAPGDDLWMAPITVDVSEFHKDPMKVSVMSCSDSAAGIKRMITSEATVMGREAAGAMLQLYQVSSNADDVSDWVTRLRKTNVVPEPKPVALATYTQSGLPCFRKQSFNLTRKEGPAAEYQQCFGEPSSNGPLTSLFNTFSCEDMNPAFYGLLWPQQVKKLHAAIAELAGRQERKPVVLTVIDDQEEDLAYHMIRSLQAAGEAANSLVVGTVPGICRDMDALYGIPSKRCVVMQPALGVRRGVFRHAILTTAALAGLSDRITLASPRVAFTRPTGAQLREEASSRRVVFARSGMTTNDTDDCAAGSDGSPSSAFDSAVIAVPDAPAVTNLLLRAWARMVTNTDVSQQMALAGALEEKADGVEAALLSCNTARLQETDKEEKSDSHFLGALAPGEKPPPVRKAKRLMDGEVEEAPKPKPKLGHWDPLAKKWIPGESQADEFKHMWDKRIEEIRETEGYNETAMREERIKKRLENRMHKKHDRTAHTHKIRYLPQAEVEKVKAKEQAWDESQRKQHEDDLAHADERKEAFKREVERQMKIMEGNGNKDDDASTDDGDLGAE